MEVESDGVYRPQRFASIWSDFREAVDQRKVALANKVNSRDCRVVYGSGNEHARVLFLGEAPGREEAKAAKPFVGPSGRLIEKELLEPMKLDREKDVFITNVMHIRPYEETERGNRHNDGTYMSKKDRPPTAREIDSHTPYMIRLLQTMKPHIIFCFGRIASTLAHNDFDVNRCLGCEVQYANEQEELQYISVGRMQGQVRPIIVPGLDHMVWMVPMFHPSYLLRIEKPSKKRWETLQWQRAFQRVWKEYMKKPQLKTPKPLTLRDIQEDRVSREILESDDPVEAARRLLWSGATAEQVERGKWTWDDPKDTFFERPPSTAVDKKEPFIFYCNEMNYNRSKNTFELFGRTKTGDGVYCSMKGFQFHFYTNLPEGMLRTIARQKRAREGSAGKGFLETPNTEEILETLQPEDYEHASTKSLLADYARRLTNHLQKESNVSENVRFEATQNDSLYGYRNRDHPPAYHLKVWVSAHWMLGLCRRAITKIWPELTQFYEADFTPDSRFTYDTRIKPCSWVELPEYHVIAERGSRQPDNCGRDMITTRDIEVEAWIKQTIAHDPSEKGWGDHAEQKILGVDIECVNADDRDNRHRFPTPNLSAVIDVCFSLQKQDDKTVFDEKGICKRNKGYVFTLRKCRKIRGAKTVTFPCEKHLLIAIFRFMSQTDFDVIVGHNVKRFDINFLLKRAEMLRLVNLTPLGRIRSVPTTITERRFQSRAFGERVILTFNTPGAAIWDTLEIYIREKKMPSYKLQDIAKAVVGDTKNDMPYPAIGGFFWGDEEANAEESEYCYKDAQLPIQLLNKGKWAYNIWEFARINGTVFPGGIYTRGQQIKVVSAFMHKLRENPEHLPAFILPTHDTKFDDDEGGEDKHDEIVETYKMEGEKDLYAALEDEVASDVESDDEEAFYGKKDDFIQQQQEETTPMDVVIEDADDDDMGDVDEQPEEEEEEKTPRERLRRKIRMARPSKSKKQIAKEIRKEMQSSITAFIQIAADMQGKSDDEEYKKATEKKTKRLLRKTAVHVDDELLDIHSKAAKAGFSTKRQLKAKAKRLQKKREEKLRRDIEKITYQGATVLPPVLGLHIIAVLCADFASLYPSIMIRYNVSHELKVLESELEKKGLTVADVHCSPVKGLHPRWKDHTFASVEEREAHKEHVYFVRQEYIRSLYGSYLERPDFVKKILQFHPDDHEVELGKHVLRVPFGLTDEAEISEARKPFDNLMPGYWDWVQARFAEDERAQREGIFFVKEEKFGMGIMPLTLVTLLDARKRAKKEMAKYPPGSPNHSIWNGTQLALKILANSLYGATGVGNGQIADQDLGAAVTAWGRVAIMLAKDEAEKKWKQPNTVFTEGCNPDETTCVGGDSVTEDTPVLVRNRETGNVRIVPIEQLGEEWSPYVGEKEQSSADQWQVWTHQGWASIRRVIRHRVTKRICRVQTPSGIVDVTEDHSLIRANETVVKPTELEDEIKAAAESSSPFGDGHNQYQAHGVDIRLLHSYPPAAQLHTGTASPPTPEQIIQAYKSGKAFAKNCSIGEGQYASPIDPTILYGHASLRRAFVIGASHSAYAAPDRKDTTIGHDDEDIPRFLEDTQYEVNPTAVGLHKLHPPTKRIAAELYFLLRSLDLTVAIEYDPATAAYSPSRWEAGGVTLMFSNSHGLNEDEATQVRCIQGIEHLGQERMVYDLEVNINAVDGGGVFQAGIGSMIVHNTDSFFEQFCFAKTVEEGMEFGDRLVQYLNKFYTLPMKLAFEKVMWPMLVIAKKRYTGNLFAGEDNEEFFAKKRWVELHYPQEEWEAIFTQRERLTEKYTPEKWQKKRGELDAADILSAEEYIEEVKDYDWDGVEVVEHRPMVKVVRLGGIGWWKKNQWKTKDEWWKILSAEEKRREAQTDEEWMADFRRPRYAGDEYNPADYGRMFAKGLEIVRRDSVPFVRETMKKFLHMAIIEGDIIEGLIYVYERIIDLLEGRVDEIELICSKAVTKEHYKSHTLPHTNLMMRMKKRGDAAPGLGDRVPFLITKGYRGQKMYERAEHPDKVIEDEIPIDYEYYVTNKCMNALNRILQFFMDNSKYHIFNIAKLTRKRQRASMTSTSQCRNFVTESIVCARCNSVQTYASEMYGVLCSRCIKHSGGKELDRLVGKKRKQLEVFTEEYSKLMKICVDCTNVKTAPCNNFGCPDNQYFKRKKAQRKMERCSAQVLDIEALMQGLTPPSVGNKRRRAEEESDSDSGSEANLVYLPEAKRQKRQKKKVDDDEKEFMEIVASSSRFVCQFCSRSHAACKCKSGQSVY